MSDLNSYWYSKIYFIYWSPKIYNSERSFSTSSISNNPKQYLEMIPLHPYMIDSQGRPDYSRRAPYPAILFYETSMNPNAV